MYSTRLEKQYDTKFIFLTFIIPLEDYLRLIQTLISVYNPLEIMIANTFEYTNERICTNDAFLRANAINPRWGN